MDKSDQVLTAIAVLRTQNDEIVSKIEALKVELEKANLDGLSRRLDRLEVIAKEQNIKLDVLNACEVKENRTESKGSNSNSGNTVTSSAEDTEDIPTYFQNVGNFFKHVWATEKRLFIEHKVVTEDDIESVESKIQSKLDKVKDSAERQKKLAVAVWKTFDEDKKNIVRSLKEKKLAEYKKDRYKGVGKE